MTKKIDANTKCLYDTIAEWPNVDGNCNDFVSVEVSVVFNRLDHLSMCYGVSGKDLEEEYGDDDLEYFVDVRRDQMPKLASKFSARDGETLIRRIAERFGPYKQNAYGKFMAFLDKKGIVYTTIMY